MFYVKGTDPGGFLIEYGSGVVAGSVAFDTVRLGTPTITIQRQGIGLADATTSAFVSASCDGLFVSHLPRLTASLSCRICSWHSAMLQEHASLARHCPKRTRVLWAGQLQGLASL